MTQAKQSTLRSYRSKLKWVSPNSSLPMSQGLALQKVIRTYDIPAKKVGYSASSSIIGVETKQQVLFWKDTGTKLEFKGIIEK